MRGERAIVGAGPAGMAAAVEAAGLGLAVAVLDEQPAPGGQVSRSVETAADDPALAGEFLDGGGALAAAFRAARGITYRPRTTVWHIAPDTGSLSVLADGASSELSARRILLATGAQDRPVPIPGWTLPGVMSAGAAQILLLDGRWRRPRRRAARRRAVERPPPARQGRGLMREAKRRGLRLTRGVRDLRAEGDRGVRHVRWQGGETACDALLLHEGVIPSTHITRALGLDHDWDERQLCWRPRLNAWGATRHGRIAVAGDGGGISGWEAAIASGRLAAIDAAHRLGRLDEPARDRRAAPQRKALRSALALRPFLDRLYVPAPGVLTPADATIACRCEEITAGQIREAARRGATGPNQVKAFLRAGMGACQGRMCGTVVAALIAEVRGATMEEVGALRPRAPFKPMTVGELAGSAEPVV